MHITLILAIPPLFLLYYTMFQAERGLIFPQKQPLLLVIFRILLLSKKHHGNISQVAEIASLCGNNLTIYSGNDDQVLPILSLGGLGVISVLSNIMPNAVHNMVHNFLNGNISSALDIQLKTLPLIKALFSEVNPIPVKAALSLMGYSGCTPRLPLVEMPPLGKDTLKQEMQKLGII